MTSLQLAQIWSVSSQSQRHCSTYLSNWRGPNPPIEGGIHVQRQHIWKASDDVSACLVSHHPVNHERAAVNSIASACPRVRRTPWGVRVGELTQSRELTSATFTVPVSYWLVGGGEAVRIWRAGEATQSTGAQRMGTHGWGHTKAHHKGGYTSVRAHQGTKAQGRTKQGRTKVRAGTWHNRQVTSVFCGQV